MMVLNRRPTVTRSATDCSKFEKLVKTQNFSFAFDVCTDLAMTAIRIFYPSIFESILMLHIGLCSCLI